jgi:small redox-active disulfide protein 2
MQIKALGGCCRRSTQNYENAVIAAKQCGITEPVEHVKDMQDIVALGVLANPGLVIDGKVVSSGRLLTVDQIVELIKKHQK